MSKKPDPKAIRAGDWIHITVPRNRYLEWGVYKARVESLAAKDRHRDGRTYHCAIEINGLDFDDPNAILIHFPLTIISHESLRGQCFLGADQFPVEFRHEQNIERRLKDSMPDQRLPYKD